MHTQTFSDFSHVLLLSSYKAFVTYRKIYGKSCWIILLYALISLFNSSIKVIYCVYSQK